ncbi:MAG: hypothetical protein ABFD18_02170 [Syntrophomonas sp.]
MESQDKCSLEMAAQVQIKTRKYQAIPLENPGKESLLLITTARKCILDAQNLCPKCGKRISPGDSRVCESCGSEACIYCLSEYQDKVLFDEED